MFRRECERWFQNEVIEGTSFAQLNSLGVGDALDMVLLIEAEIDAGWFSGVVFVGGIRFRRWPFVYWEQEFGRCLRPPGSAAKQNE